MVFFVEDLACDLVQGMNLSLPYPSVSAGEWAAICFAHRAFGLHGIERKKAVDSKQNRLP